MLNSNWRLLHILHFDLFHEFTFQIDNVEKPSWQAQVTGHKLWTIEAPPECYHVCEQKLEVIIKPGEICKYNFHLWCLMLCSQVLLHYIVFFQKSGWGAPRFGDNLLNWQPLGHVINPDSKVHGASMGPTWALSAPAGPHVGPMNIAIREALLNLWACVGSWCHPFIPYLSESPAQFNQIGSKET